MTQGATACAAVMLPRRLEAVVPWPPEFSCQKVLHERINNGSVKALLPAKGDFLPFAQVACSVRALVSRKKNELVNKAKAAGLTTADFLQSAASGSDHGGQRQTKA